MCIVLSNFAHIERGVDLSMAFYGGIPKTASWRKRNSRRQAEEEQAFLVKARWFCTKTTDGFFSVVNSPSVSSSKAEFPNFVRGLATRRAHLGISADWAANNQYLSK